MVLTDIVKMEDKILIRKDNFFMKKEESNLWLYNFSNGIVLE